MSAIGFSEHGSVFQWVKKKTYAEKNGLKYIHAAEFYITETLEEKIRDNKHAVLIAKNYAGVKELNRLSTASFNKDDGHKYYHPRISLNELIETSDNIIVTTACIGGILYEGSKEMRKRFLEFLIKNKHRCYLEIQHHNVEKQKKYNKYLYNLNLKYGVPLIAGTDTHALNDDHVKGRSILQLSKGIRFSEEDGWDLTFKTYDELVYAYKKQGSLPEDVFLEAIDNTNVMSENIEDFELDYSYKYPKLWDSPEETFRKLIEEGVKRRGVDKYDNHQEYLDRIEYEIDVYKHNQAIDFMLLMEDIIRWCDSQNIKVGYGRGSVNGSVIAWLLGITEMDSIKHNLNFERFMNSERVSLSDIDTDFPPSRRDEVKDYIFNKTGLYCSDIITFNTIALKGAIRDVARALHISLDVVGKICDRVETEEEEIRKEYPELFEYVDLVNGTIVSVGSHPCGTVVSPHTIDDEMGMFTTGTSNYPISQINMKEIDSLNYVKLDLLALDTAELINKTCELAGIERLTPDNVNVDDIEVWQSMRDDTTQIFQWDGSTGQSYIKRLMSDKNLGKLMTVNPKLDRMTLLSIGNSAIRPAGSSYRDELASGIVRTTGSKAIDDFLANTFGYLVFQEQIIDFLHRYCGYTMGEADIVRRGFAKKTGTEQHIPRIKEGFIETMIQKYGATKAEAEREIVAFIQVIEDASNYLFSLNHSQPYSYEGYVSAYLRYYYPLEFICTALNINQDKEDKTVVISTYAKRNNIEIKPIRFRYSTSTYSIDKTNNCIYKGMASIKFMNSTVADELYALGRNEYKSFVELLTHIKATSVNTRQLLILIKLDFFEEFGEINTLLGQYDYFNKIYGKKQFKVDQLEVIGIPHSVICKLANKQTEKLFKDFDSLELLEAVLKTVEFPKTTLVNKLEYEGECLGYVQTVVPNASPQYAYVQNYECKFKNPKLMLYRLCNGDLETVKVKRAKYDEKPIREGDIIKTIECSNEGKWFKDENDEWKQNKEDRETILKKWSFVK